MKYGDEFMSAISPGFNPDQASAEELGRLFRKAQPISHFHSAPDQSFFQHPGAPGLKDSQCFKVNEDCIIEINTAFLRNSIVISNEVADLISFQFVATVSRSEFLGQKKNVHDLGPAIIVTAIPSPQTTYRLPKVNEPVRHVMLHTTLSNLMQRLGERASDYPNWLQEILSGEHDQPRQRVLFLENIHRDLIWSCFHLPVSGALLPPWLSAKFQELLCIGLQILKNSQSHTHPGAVHYESPHSKKIRTAVAVLNSEYANPPTLPDLAQKLGISETQLKSGFKAMTGTTVLQYCISKRIEAAKLLLSENRQSISEIGDIVGYQDHSAFSRAFHRLTGCSPRRWRLDRQTGPE